MESTSQAVWLFSCANVSAKGACPNAATMACEKCLYVAYCSESCRTAHQDEHRKDCESEFFGADWKPKWHREMRKPVFNPIDCMLPISNGPRQFVWANAPALDVVRLADNEGLDFAGPLPLLFAMAGDPRNLIESVVHLSPAYAGKVTAVLNDMCFDIVARDIVFFLVLLSTKDAATAADHALHILYSAFLPDPVVEVLQTRVAPMIATVCEKIASKSDDIILAKVWPFGRNGRFRVALTRNRWMELQKMLDIRAGPTREAALQIRTSAVLDPSHDDFVDRYLFCQRPHERLGFLKNHGDGLLLPFGADRSGFTTPNPTVFNTKEWPMVDITNPMAGWPLKEIKATDAGPASHDVYGKLHRLVTERLFRFREQLELRPTELHVYNVLDENLHSTVPGLKFARIDAPLMGDIDVCGVGTTLKMLSPLLQSRADNPHATLVMLLVNVVPVGQDMLGPDEAMRADDLLQKYVKQIYHTNTRLELLAAMGNFPKIACGWNCLPDCERAFNVFWAFYGPNNPAAVGLVQKTTNTIVKRWPLRLRQIPGDEDPTPEDCEAYLDLLGSTHAGNECYLEWKSIE